MNNRMEFDDAHLENCDTQSSDYLPSLPNRKAQNSSNVGNITLHARNKFFYTAGVLGATRTDKNLVTNILCI